MVSTTTHRAALNTLYNDNSAGEISAADMRQGFVNVFDDIDTLNGETYKVGINIPGVTIYSLVASDSGKLVLFNTNSAVSVSVVNNTLPAGFTCMITNIGTGVVTIGPFGGATLLSRGSVFKLAGPYAIGTVIMYTTSNGLLCGDLV